MFSCQHMDRIMHTCNVQCTICQCLQISTHSVPAESHILCIFVHYSVHCVPYCAYLTKCSFVHIVQWVSYCAYLCIIRSIVCHIVHIWPSAYFGACFVHYSVHIVHIEHLVHFSTGGTTSNVDLAIFRCIFNVPRRWEIVQMCTFWCFAECVWWHLDHMVHLVASLCIIQSIFVHSLHMPPLCVQRPPLVLGPTPSALGLHIPCVYVCMCVCVHIVRHCI